MTREQLAVLQTELATLTDTALASLIFERVDVEPVAALLGEEVLRRLTSLRANQHRGAQPIPLFVPNRHPVTFVTGVYSVSGGLWRLYPFCHRPATCPVTPPAYSERKPESVSSSE